MRQILILALLLLILAGCAPPDKSPDAPVVFVPKEYVITTLAGEKREMVGYCEQVSTKQCGIYVYCSDEEGIFFKGVVASLEYIR